MSEERYRVVPAAIEGLSCVEHLDGKGAWCGPLVPADDHPRADELGAVEIICSRCGDYELCGTVNAPPAAIVRKVRRLHAAWLRFERESDAFAVSVAKIKAAGIDTSKMVYRPPVRRRRRERQLQLFK